MTPGRADRRVVDRHLAALRRALAALRRHAGVSALSLRADSDRRWTIERGLQLCAQNTLEVASYLSAAAGFDPTSYGSSIDCLVEAKVLPAQFGARFRGVAGFRNVLVHGYLDVDLELIAGILTGSLDDFEEFAAHVERWLAETVEPQNGEPRSPDGQTAPALAIGVDGCSAGWFYVALEPAGTTHCGVVRAVQDLVRDAREPARLFIDIPIGLPDGPGGRECDQLARRTLGPRASSVFPAPARAVLDAVDYEDAKRRSREATGKSLSKQAWAIVPKCREVDRLLRDDAKARRIVREVHPELCFWALAGRRPMQHGKKHEQGFQERIGVLKRVHPSAARETEGMLERRPRSVARDDILDAMIAAVTAAADDAEIRTLPSRPPRDELGLPMEMAYVERDSVIQ